MTADPAIAAAMKAMLSVESPTVRDTAIAAAREALAPLRELHTPDEGHNPECYCCIPANAYCNECGEDWPCDTAKLIYPEDEL